MNEIENGRVAPGRRRTPVTTTSIEEAATTADVDLAGIDPVHWAETRERVAILRAWCANGRHPRHEALAAAARMGTTVSHFYRLVATWKRHRDARLVSGHSTRRGDTRHAQAIAAAAQAIITRVIDARGTEARFTDVLAEVRSECAAADVTPPSSGLVHKMMMRARQSSTGGTTGKADDVAVAVVSCLLPVALNGGTVDAPELVLAVERPGGIIVGHRMVIGEDVVAEARTLLGDLAARAGGRILVAAPLADAVNQGAVNQGAVDQDAVDQDAVGDEPNAAPPPLVIAQDARIEVSSRSTLLSTMLGSYIDSIPIRHRGHATRAPGPWRPLSPADAVAAVDLAVAAHNARRRG
ncbi:hypothetical protein [Sphingomonas bacterium]|uniref:hypothetical protein n=1 Tax=Sphingomonas bacterium TaxID=1895847 RepID=UPI001576E0AD|nr:hypothetical protein [Sphingomonas bacterium]